jgi:hypothetical protein
MDLWGDLWGDALPEEQPPQVLAVDDTAKTLSCSNSIELSKGKPSVKFTATEHLPGLGHTDKKTNYFTHAFLICKELKRIYIGRCKSHLTFHH